MYGGREQYENRRRERFSPPRHDMGHQVKRMRRDWWVRCLVIVMEMFGDGEGRDSWWWMRRLVMVMEKNSHWWMRGLVMVTEKDSHWWMRSLMMGSAKFDDREETVDGELEVWWRWWRKPLVNEKFDDGDRERQSLVNEVWWWGGRRRLLVTEVWWWSGQWWERSLMMWGKRQW